MASKLLKQMVDETKANMDMTPMIDCTFQLLIFFMLGCKFKSLEQKLNSFLPKDTGPSSAPPPDERLPSEVHLTASGPDGKECTIRLGIKPIADWTELRDQISARHNNDEKKQNLPVNIYGTDNLRWKWICKAFDTAIGTGCEKVQFSVSKDNTGINIQKPK